MKAVNGTIYASHVKACSKNHTRYVEFGKGNSFFARKTVIESGAAANKGYCTGSIMYNLHIEMVG